MNRPIHYLSDLLNNDGFNTPVKQTFIWQVGNSHESLDFISAVARKLYSRD